jgi:hypothetical protein
MAPILGIIASQQPGHIVYNSYESIATVTVGGGGSSSISFSSIPSTYKHLQVRFIGRWSTGTTGEGALRMAVNGTVLDKSHYVLGTGTAASSGAPTGYIASIPEAGESCFAGGVLDLLDYTSTSKNKTVRNLTGYDNNGTGTSLIILYSGLAITTSAVTSLTFDNPSYNFGQYSSFALYGVKG